jgi:hypothetical protein
VLNPKSNLRLELELEVVFSCGSSYRNLHLMCRDGYFCNTLLHLSEQVVLIWSSSNHVPRYERDLKACSQRDGNIQSACVVSPVQHLICNREIPDSNLDLSIDNPERHCS